MKKTFTYTTFILASIAIFVAFLFLSPQAQATNLFLSTVGTSTFPGGINMGTGCFSVNNVCLTSGTSPTGTTGQVDYFSGTNIPVGTSTLFISTASRVGIGTTSPDRIFTVYGNQSGGIADLIRAPGALAASTQYGVARLNLFTTDSKVATSSGPFLYFSESTSTQATLPLLTGAIGAVESPNPAAFSIGNAPGGIWTDLMLYGGLPYANSVATNNWLDVSGNNGVLVATSTVYNSAFAVQDLGSLTNIASFYDNTGAPKLTLSNTGTLNLTTTTGCYSVNGICVEGPVTRDTGFYSTTNTATTTVKTFTVAGGTLTTTGILQITGFATSTSVGGGGYVDLKVELGTGSATTTLFQRGDSTSYSIGQNNVGAGSFVINIRNMNSASQQTTSTSVQSGTSGTAGEGNITSFYGASAHTSYNTASNVYIALSIATEGGSDTSTLSGLTVRVIP